MLKKYENSMILQVVDVFNDHVCPHRDSDDPDKVLVSV